MKSYWKEKEVERIKCIYCRNNIIPRELNYENTKRKICPCCGATLEIIVKKKKLKPRDW